MENSYDLNLVGCDFIKHSEGKAPHNHASESFVDNWIHVRVANIRESASSIRSMNSMSKSARWWEYRWGASASSASASGVNRMIICD
jgi:hypothetical protein